MLSATDLATAAKAIDEAAEILRRGGLVAFPTETVYGLGADARDGTALRSIYAAKGRPSDNPLIVHAADAPRAFSLAESVATQAHMLADAFWPGPLSLVLPKSAEVPDEVSGGLQSVAVRVPDHPVALALLERFDGPLAAPSANLSGRPSPTSAKHVWHDLAGRIDAILDGGETGVGLESTVVDLTTPIPCVLRLGGLPLESLERLLGDVEVATKLRETDTGQPVRSPGLKYRHYAPNAPLYVLIGDRRTVVHALSQLYRDAKDKGRRAGFLLTQEAANLLNIDPSDRLCYVLGPLGNPDAVARRLYAGLRYLDAGAPEVIVAEGIDGSGLGRAVADRLQRAAEGSLLQADEVLARGTTLRALLEGIPSG